MKDFHTRVSYNSQECFGFEIMTQRMPEPLWIWLFQFVDRGRYVDNFEDFQRKFLTKWQTLPHII